MKVDGVAAVNIASLDFERLKASYLECMGVCMGNRAKRNSLTQIVKELTAQGVCRCRLLEWAVEAGYGKRSASSLLSRIYCSLGLRERKTGAGPKHSAEALKLAAYAYRLCGKDFRNKLRAASKVSEEEIPADEAQIPGKASPLLRSSISPNLLTLDAKQAMVGGEAG